MKEKKLSLREGLVKLIDEAYYDAFKDPLSLDLLGLDDDGEYFDVLTDPLVLKINNIDDDKAISIVKEYLVKYYLDIDNANNDKDRYEKMIKFKNYQDTCIKLGII